MDCKAAWCISAGRSVCTEHGCQYSGVSRLAGDFIKHPIGMYCGICRTHLFCGRGSAASCEKSAADNETDPYDTDLLLRWKRVLSVLRLAGKNAFCPDGTEHQYGDCSVRSTGCDHCDDAAEEVKFVTLKFVYNGRLA